LKKSPTKRKKKSFIWSARSVQDRLEELYKLLSVLRVKIADRYERIVPEEVKLLAAAFDMETASNLLSKLSIREDGNIFHHTREQSAVGNRGIDSV